MWRGGILGYYIFNERQVTNNHIVNKHERTTDSILTQEWIGKAIWAIAGFFLIATYNEVKETSIAANEIKQQNARIESTLQDYGARIERLEIKMDLYDQSIKDFYQKYDLNLKDN